MISMNALGPNNLSPAVLAGFEDTCPIRGNEFEHIITKLLNFSIMINVTMSNV